MRIKRTEDVSRKFPMKNIDHWVDSMKGKPVFIIGNGPSLIDKDIKFLEDYFTIGINRAFFKIDPTILMWQDLALWIQEKKRVVALKAIKFCRSAAENQGGKDFYYFKLVGRDYSHPKKMSMLTGRGNTAPLVFQTASLLGCDPIIAVGIDCRYGPNGETNFYGKNPMHRTHTLPFCKKGLKWVAGAYKAGRVINCSQNKILGEKLSIEQAIIKYDIKKMEREEIKQRITQGK